MSRHKLKDRHKLHKLVLNGAHKRAAFMKQDSSEDAASIKHIGAISDVNGNRTSGNHGSQEPSATEPRPDRTLLHLDVNPSSDTAASTPEHAMDSVSHKAMCSPDSTTEGFNVASKSDDNPTAEENNKDSPVDQEPKWYLSGPDGNMEEMDVSFDTEKRDVSFETDGSQRDIPRNIALEDYEDVGSQGTRDTDDIDVTTSALDSPACSLSPEPVEPTSTTNGLVTELPHCDMSPTEERTGSVNTDLLDSSSLNESEDVNLLRTVGEAFNEGQNKKIDKELEGDLSIQEAPRPETSSENVAPRPSIASVTDSDIDDDSDQVMLKNDPLVSTIRLSKGCVTPKKVMFLSSAAGLDDTPEKHMGLNTTPVKKVTESPNVVDSKSQDDVFRLPMDDENQG